MDKVDSYPEEQMYEEMAFLSEQAGILAGHLWTFCK
jgi:hypothetical protein